MDHRNILRLKSLLHPLVPPRMHISVDANVASPSDVFTRSFRAVFFACCFRRHFCKLVHPPQNLNIHACFQGKNETHLIVLFSCLLLLLVQPHLPCCRRGRDLLGYIPLTRTGPYILRGIRRQVAWQKRREELSSQRDGFNLYAYGGFFLHVKIWTTQEYNVRQSLL